MWNHLWLFNSISAGSYAGVARSSNNLYFHKDTSARVTFVKVCVHVFRYLAVLFGCLPELQPSVLTRGSADCDKRPPRGQNTEMQQCSLKKTGNCGRGTGSVKVPGFCRDSHTNCPFPACLIFNSCLCPFQISAPFAVNIVFFKWNFVTCTDVETVDVMGWWTPWFSVQ